MKSVIFASGADHMEQSDRCRNWVAGQGFPGAEVVVDDFDALWERIAPGDVQLLVADRLADLPDEHMYLVLGLPAAGVALVAVSDEIDTRAGGQQGAAQKRVVESIYRWLCVTETEAAERSAQHIRESLADGSMVMVQHSITYPSLAIGEASEPAFVSRPMKAKEIKFLQAILKETGASKVTQDEEMMPIMERVAKVMNEPAGLVKEWVWAVLGKEA